MTSVVGTVLMVVITVAALSGVAVVVLDEVGDAQRHQTTELSVLAKEDISLILSHDGGEPIRLTEGQVLLGLVGRGVTLPLTLLGDQTADGEVWAIGDTLCIVGSATDCLYPSGTTVTGLQVIAGDRLLLTHGDPSGVGGDVPVDVEDPGFPYEDVDGDGQYTEGVDGPIDPVDIQDGSYDAGDNDLVIPDSVGDIESGTIDYAGKNVVVTVDLTATDGHMGITADEDLTIEGALTIANDNKNIDLTAGGDITIRDADLNIRGHLNLAADGNIYADGASLRVLSLNNNLYVDAGGLLDLTEATVEANGTVTLEGGTVTADNLTMDFVNASKAYTIQATATTVTMRDAYVRGESLIQVLGATGVEAPRATMDNLPSGNSDITIRAYSGDVHVENGDLQAKRNLNLLADSGTVYT